MAKILAQAGKSLSRIYNTVGSKIGVEQLQSEDVSLIHEMGGTIAAERMTTRFLKFSSGALAQNITTQSDVPSAGPIVGMQRILGIVVVADTAARVTRIMVSLNQPAPSDDFVLFSWDTSIDAERPVLMRFTGAGATVHSQFVPLGTQPLPSLLGGTEQPLISGADQFSARGLTSGFGAGTVTITAMIYLAEMLAQGTGSKGAPGSSHGLALPSW